MPFKDNHQFVDFLEKKKELVRTRAVIDQKYEIGAFCHQLFTLNGPAALLENVKGTPFPVLVNAFGTRRRLAMALETNERNLMKAYLAKRHCDWPTPRIVKNGPCREVVFEGKQVDLRKQIPQITWNEKDGGPYITAGAVTTKDPETKTRNTSVRRLMIHGKTRTGIMAVSGSHTAIHMQKAIDRNKPLEVAITIGMDPCIYIASVANLKIGDDHFAFAGALRKEPVELVKCGTVDLEVPAYSEFVLEGEIPPDILQVEGPFGEAMCYYGLPEKNPIIEVKSVTRREKPIYQGFYIKGPPPPSEDHIIRGFQGEIGLLEQIRSRIPAIRDFNLMPEGNQALIGAVSIRQTERALARRVMENVWSTDIGSFVKYLIVVDDDIDVHDTSQVLWAVATRSQPHKDVVIIPEAPGLTLDPSQETERVTSRIGIDATRPLGQSFPDTVSPPRHVFENVKKRWKELIP